MEETSQSSQAGTQECPPYPMPGSCDPPPDYSSFQDFPTEQLNVNHPCYSHTTQSATSESLSYPSYPTIATQDLSPPNPTIATQDLSPPNPTIATQSPYAPNVIIATQGPYPPYPTTAIQGPHPPMVYPTNYIPTAGIHQHYDPRVPPTQQQSVYSVTLPSTSHQFQTNLPGYPRTSSPRPYPQMASQPGYPTNITLGPQHISLQDPSAATTIPQYSASPPNYNNYLCWSLLNMMFCICPVGVVALIFSCKTGDAMVRRDWMAARKYSNVAFTLNVFSLAFGVILYIFAITMYFTSRRQLRY